MKVETKHFKDLPKGSSQFPYLPNQPKYWAQMKELFAAAATVHTNTMVFVAHVDHKEFWFQEWGNPMGVVVTK